MENQTAELKKVNNLRLLFSKKNSFLGVSREGISELILLLKPT